MSQEHYTCCQVCGKLTGHKSAYCFDCRGTPICKEERFLTAYFNWVNFDVGGEFDFAKQREKEWRWQAYCLARDGVEKTLVYLTSQGDIPNITMEFNKERIEKNREKRVNYIKHLNRYLVHKLNGMTFQ